MNNEKSSTTSQLIKNSFWNFLMVFLAKIGGLVFVILLARFLLPEKFGIYNLALAASLLIVALTNIGTNQTLSRYVSEALGKNNKRKATAYYQYLLRIKILFAMISMSILFILAYSLSNYLFKKPDLFLPLLISGIYAVSLSMQSFYETFFYAIKKVKILATKELILQTSKITLVLIFFFLIGKYVFLALFAFILGSLIAILFLIFNLKKNISFLFTKKSGKINKERIKHFLKGSIFSSFSSMLFGQIDIILLGIFVTSAYIGYYSAAFLIVSGIFGLISFSNVVLPIFTQLKLDKIQVNFNRICRYLSIITLPIIFGIFILGKDFLILVYGSEYLNAVWPLFFLSFIIFETPISENLRALLFAKEKPNIVAKIMFFAMFFNIFLSVFLLFFLIQYSLVWAITGVAIATAVSRFFVFFSLLIITKRELRVSFKINSLTKPFISAALMALILFLINLNLSKLNSFIIIGEIFAGAIIYFLILLLIKGVNKKDFLLIKELLN